MKKYGLNELRKMYLDFFKSKDHFVRGSYSLVPHNDNSLLLINAAMLHLSLILQDRRFHQREEWLHARSV